MIVQKNEARPLGLKGAFVLSPMVFRDERGDFTKTYTRQILKSIGVEPYFCEEYVSYSKMNVLRGLHFQTGGHAQAKLVRCIKGEIFDVIVDLRKSSPTFGKWAGVALSEENMLSIYVPRGFAHGFMALGATNAVLYKADNDYSPENEGGLFYADPMLGISWPHAPAITLSEKDSKWPGFAACAKFDYSSPRK